MNHRVRVKEAIKYGMKRTLPSGLFFHLLTWKWGYPEPELRLLPYLCSRSKVSIDVGASTGLYVVYMHRLSKACYAFEPRQDAAWQLEKLLSGLDPPVHVESVALSDYTGSACFRVCLDDLGRSTLEEGNDIETFGNVETVPVPVRRLDEYEFHGETVGCIKIDVEGHEESVLRGARQLLARDHPSLIIEIEERHRSGSVEAVRRLLYELEYKGYFFCGHRLVPMESFNAAEHQNIDHIHNGTYINNFVFVAAESLPRIERLIR